MNRLNMRHGWTLAAALAALVIVAPDLRAAEPDAKAPPAKTPGFDINALDKSADPCSDFYQFACGGWRAANPIPPDQSSWGRFNELAERNRETLHHILESAAKGPRTPQERLIGDYYGACMDEATIEKKGVSALAPELDRIAALKSRAELPALVGRLHGAGVGAFFGFTAEQDFKNTTQVLALADQGGLGLPDRDYYFRSDARSVELRRKYEEHVVRIFRLLGERAATAKASAAAVMEIETALASGALDVVSRRDPNKIYHKTAKTELLALTPAFAWERYFAQVGAAADSLNVTEPDFFKSLDALLKKADVGKLRSYLRWQLVHASAGKLPAGFVNEDFEFFGKTLTGAKELRPRWKRCVDATDQAAGEALGQLFVERTFGSEGKQRMAVMVAGLERALAADILALPWMTEATKLQALGKLKAIANKVGYPDRWRDYSDLKVVRGDALGNAQRAAAFEFRRQLGKIGKPVDRGEWGMTPPTVNAYYNPLMNDINFPAGILQPPFFDKAMDDGVNFGAIGAVIGHELSHGFDDQGRQFAADGNLKDWWTAEDGKAFEQRAACVADQYSGYTAVDDVKINGKLTLGENVADNGGLRIAYMALLEALAGKDAAPLEGFTPTQRFFLGWGQVWCQNRTPEAERLRAQTDPHSSGRYRVNGVVSNMPEFQRAFACPAGAPMVRGETACRVW